MTVRGDDRDAVAALKAKAEAGDAAAQENLAVAYFNGNGVEKDHALAFQWAMKAAAQGNIIAEGGVSWAYRNGDGVAKNEPASFSWEQKAADLGDAGAEVLVGDHYSSGTDVPQDFAKAFGWYFKAAQQNNMTALWDVGTSYMKGVGVEKDQRKGFIYTFQSAGAGNYYAAYGIAYCYQYGTFVKPDLVQAYRWCLIAIQLGPKDKATALTAEMMKTLGSQLTAEQVAQAQKMAARTNEWLQGNIQDENLGAAFSSPSVTVPFEYQQKQILVQVKIKGTPFTFILDTGSQTILDERAAAKLGISGSDYLTIAGHGPDIGLGTIADPFSLQVSGVAFNNARALILPIDFNTVLGRPIDGFLGSDLLKYTVVSINFTDKTVTFTRPEAFQVAKDMDYAIPVGFGRAVPFLVGRFWNGSTRAGAVNLDIDTGDAANVSVSSGYQRDTHLLDLATATPVGGIGFGGISYGHQGLVTAMLAGGLMMESVSVEAQGDIHPAYNSPWAGTIGNGIWERFDFTLDYPDATLFLRKNAKFSDPYQVAELGLDIRTAGPDYVKLTIDHVLDGSLGSKAGFKPGDVITKVDDLTGDQVRIAKVFSQITTPGNHQITVKRDGTDYMSTLEWPEPKQ